MPLRIADLIAMPELRTRPLAGRTFDRPVRWAHVCELPDPTEWLGEGDLLMTTGIGIPATPPGQAAYIAALSQAGLAGVMIGDNMQAPADLSALCAAAADLDFPVLLTEYGVPFASVTRAVIDAGRQAEFDRRNTLNRLFVSARAAMDGLGPEDLLRRLEKDIGAGLCLLDPAELGRVWLPEGRDLPAALRAVLRRQPPEFSDTQPLVRRYPGQAGDVLAVAVPSRRAFVLLVQPAGDAAPDYGVLHHLVTVMGMALDRLLSRVEQALSAGADLLDDLLALRLSAPEAARRLAAQGLDPATACVALARPAEAALTAGGLCDRMVRLQRQAGPVLLRRQGEDLIMLAAGADLPHLHRAFGTAIGHSQPLGRADRGAEALREARLALSHAGPQGINAYAGGGRVPWLPATLTEAAQVFQQVLGPVQDYDAAQGSDLIVSLRVFLEENRSWQAAAARLGIHKTTLIYRIRKVESLTGHALDSTDGVTVLWLALRAGEIAGEK
ncbi:PucR family transcriptional regulator [Novispirillum itersonii]|uniref:PucR family transcriptional regulator n=1 Tax=Novispirillum itersonii TaxID=189 RepID=UPI00036F3CCA|nr:PucR family transcriptional regulator [Novispirillum itersonii]